MTSTLPPNVIIFSTINFNPYFYNTSASQYLTQQGALGSFLSYPIAQGTETLQNTNVNGILSIQGINIFKTNNNILEFTNPNINPAGYAFLLPNSGVNPNQLIIYPAGIQINNNVQLNGYGLSLDSNNNVGFKMSNSFQTINIVNVYGNYNFCSSVGGTNYITISPTQTIINTATQINNLTSTTQILGTNNLTVATTAFVQNAINALPSSYNIIPYFRFTTTTTTQSQRWLNPFGFSFIGSSWGINDFFTIRLNISVVSYTTSAPLNYNLTCLMDIYPNRCPSTNAYGSNSNNYTTVGSSGFPQMNGSIYSGGTYISAFFVPTDSTYAPYGRYYNTYSIQLINNLNIAQQPNCLPIYPYITQSTQQTNFGFQLWQWLNNTQPSQYSITCELIGNTSNNNISSYGINQFTNYYTTF